MSSITTNVAAMTALQTLRASANVLGKLQSDAATGLRVAEASHNAAYWSISVTMRSDSKALSTVVDALGLGIALADVAYSATSSVVDVLSEFKAKLVLAKTEGVDRRKIQAELDQLKQQVLGIATSATFSGANWLHTDHPDNLAELSSYEMKLLASFNRSSSGSISVGTIDVDLIRSSLFNVGGGGALQVDPRSLGDIGGLRNQNLSHHAARGYEHYEFTGPVTFDDDDAVRFNLTLDAGPHSGGESFNVVINKGVIDAALGTSDGYIGDPFQMSRVMSEALQQAGAPASSGYNPNPSYYIFSISTTEGTEHPGSSVSITLTDTLDGGRGAMGLENPPLADYDNLYAHTQFAFTGPFRVHNDVVFSFDIEVGADAPVTVSVDRDTVDAVLGTDDGIVPSAGSMASLLDHVMSGYGLNAVAVGSQILISVDQALYPEAGTRSRLSIGNVTDNIGLLPDFDLVDVDITEATADIDNYINGLEGMHDKAVSAASNLGAVKSRLAMQASFTSQLLNAIDRGIGQLVDADMGEVSSRLQAERAREQLAIQALSIANTAPQAILQLFRNA